MQCIPMRRHWRQGCLLGLLTAASMPALAQQEQQDGEEALPAISVSADKRATTSATRLQAGTDNSSLPTPVSVIGREDIERSNVGRDITDLLRRVPGVMAHTIDQGDIGDAIKMRGFLTASHGADVAVYIDGVPQNVPSSAINHGMNDMSWLSPQAIERIEVVKGPFSAMYGDQNRAGAVEITTRNSAPDSIGVTIGSQGTRRVDTVLSGQAGPIQSLLVADWYQTQGFRANNDGHRGSIFLKESMVADDGLWALRLAHQEAAWNAPGFLNVDDLRSGRVADTARDTSTLPLWGDAHRTSLVMTREPLTPGQGWRMSLYAEDYARRRAVGAGSTALNVQEDRRRIMGARAVQDWQLSSDAALSLGGELRRDVGVALNRNWPNGVAGSNYSLDQDLNLLSYGVFGQGQYKPWSSLKLLAGLRLDGFDYDIVNRKLPAASLRYRQAVATPKVGVVWAPLDALELFANSGSGFRSPAQSELSPSGSLGPLGASGGSAFPDLKPSKVSSYDVGLTLRPSAQWRVSAASYHTVNANEIAQVAPNVYGSVGNTTRDGWELDTAYDFSPELSAYASLGRLLRARINSAAAGSATELSVPRSTWKAGVAYVRPWLVGKLTMNADAALVTGVPYFSGTPLVRNTARPYARYDLRATYSIGQVDWTAALVLQPSAYSSEVVVGSTAGLMIDPVPRTQVMLSMRYRF